MVSSSFAAGKGRRPRCAGLGVPAHERRDHAALEGGALVLTTRGRRSGRERQVLLQYFRDGDAMVLGAANDGGATHPGWYHNLVARPDARVEVMGRVRAPDYERYQRATDRRVPIIRLVPAAAVV